MSRHIARKSLFKLIYERLVNGEKNPLTFDIYLKSISAEQKDYFCAIYEDIESKIDFLCAVIERYATDFVLERIYKVDLSILLLCGYEILFMDDVPDIAAINEALEIAKVYSTEKSSIFINGVLASIKRDKEALLCECEDN